MFEWLDVIIYTYMWVTTKEQSGYSHQVKTKELSCQLRKTSLMCKTRQVSFNSGLLPLIAVSLFDLFGGFYCCFVCFKQ